MKVQIINDKLDPSMFQPSTDGSAGIDLRSTENLFLKPDAVYTVHTGIKVAIPKGYVGMLYPRSSSGVKGLALANTVGIIDSDYRGEILLKFRCIGRHFEILELDRIAQLVVVPHYDYSDLDFVSELDTTDRGEGGFGSTGKS